MALTAGSKLQSEQNYDNFFRMKVALAQISPRLGDIQYNLRLHMDYIQKAKKKNVDLLIFPELSLTGYTLRDLVEQVAIQPKSDFVLRKLKALSHGISFVVGFVEEKDRGIFFNSAAYFSHGKIVQVHRKVYLPTYGMFEELKFFGQGCNFHAFPTAYGKAGMMICYDFLHISSSYLLFIGGAELIIVISAAPGRGFSNDESYASARMWELMGEVVSRFFQAFVFYCNRIGFEDGKSFAGGSYIYNPGGQLLAQAPYVDEDFLVKTIDLKDIRRFRKNRPYRRDEKPEVILEAFKRIIEKNED